MQIDLYATEKVFHHIPMDPQKRPPMRLIKLVLIVRLYPLSESTNVEMQFWHSHEVVQILEWLRVELSLNMLNTT